MLRVRRPSELPPEVGRDRRGAAARGAASACSDEAASSVPSKSCARRRAERGVLRGEDPALAVRRLDSDASASARRPRAGSRRVVQHAAAVHRGRDGRRGVRQHGDALVERLDQRHAESFVLAGAEEQVGDVVQRRQLLVGDLAEDVDVVDAERAR